MEVLRLRQDRLRWVQSDGDVIALDEESLLYLTANASGALLWNALAEGATREQLVGRLAEAYGLDPAEVTEDVDRYLAELEAQGLLER